MARKSISTRVIQVAAVIAALGVIGAAGARWWPSPLLAEFLTVAGESLDNTIARVQERKRFLEAEKVRAIGWRQKIYWETEEEKNTQQLKALWIRKYGPQK